MQRSMISMALAAVSLRDLALVQAVYREGSFNRAARAMHISPSGLSHQVQKVEQALGVPLFERGGRSILPTMIGRRLSVRLEAVLAAAEDLQHAAQTGGAAFGGELRLGVLSTLGPYLLPHLVEPFPQRFPGTRLGLSEGKPRGLLRRLHEGELDVVLAPPGRRASGIATQPLFFEPYEILLHAAHPLAGRATLRLDEVRAEDAMLMAESHDSDAVEAAGDNGYVQDVSLESLAALVALRGGHALVPGLAHDRLASIPDVVLAAIEGEAPGRHIALYWREALPWRDDLQALVAVLRQVARRIPGLRLEPAPTRDGAG
jgi:LysR family hydrogen peroxide-inducible transcriptional activator